MDDDDPPVNTVASTDFAAPSQEMDIMNDPEFNPPPQPTRQNTDSNASEMGSENTPTCRICRSEGTTAEPLFYPCKCSGSIKFVHQECLMEWLSHSHKKHCELCKTPFRFTKLYDADMPTTLPWGVFVRRACWHVVLMVLRFLRTALVGGVWLGLVPWMIRWVWRFMFWMADAAWAREPFVRMVQATTQPAMEEGMNETASMTDMLWRKLPGFSMDISWSTSTDPTNISHSISIPPAPTFSWPRADPSILSSWGYLATLTPSERLNRVILDIFEGQLITCVIITGFILVFLIREWVVQQQPLANLNNVQEQLREAAERVQADNERLRRQQELLEQARARLTQLQNETEGYVAEAAEALQSEGAEAGSLGWEVLESVMDQATRHLRKGGEEEHKQFLTCAELVTSQIRTQSNAGGGEFESVEKLSDKVYEKLASYSVEERKEWEAVIVSEFAKNREKPQTQPADLDTVVAEAAEASSTRARRPQMPRRDIGSRATQIQRILTEAEEVFQATQQQRTSTTAAEAEAPSSPSVLSAPSSESWQEVTPPNENEQNATAPAPAPSTSTLNWKTTTIPITNAGPDAKINIRWSGTSRAPAGLKIHEKMLDVDEKLSELKEELDKEAESEKTEASATTDTTAQPEEQVSDPTNNNPFHPEGPEPEPRDDSFRENVARAFRQEIGLEDDGEYDEVQRADLGDDDQVAEPEPQIEDTTPAPPDNHPPNRWERVADWFWGDIQPTTNIPEPVPAAEEERQEPAANEAGQVAPFVPAQDAQPAPEPAAEQPQNDPEVVAAAQQAGLDPEAIEDAEDLEGIFELIGLQGPLIGLLQTSAFCLLLVACTIMGAVIVPYLGGKAVLSVSSDPIYFFLQLPLQLASTVVDFCVDAAILIASAVALVAASAVDFAQSGIATFLPVLSGIEFSEQCISFCRKCIIDAGGRLQLLLATFGELESWGWAFLRWSVHAHAALKDIEAEVDAVMHAMGVGITWVVETVSSGSVMAVCKEALSGVTNVSGLSTLLNETWTRLQESTGPLIDSLAGLMRGKLVFSKYEVPSDPTLVYWDSTDRALAILAGYSALAALAAIYVAADTPITTSEGGQKTEKKIRDTLRQAGGVLKVILIISIEMLVFPLYCGLLLDVAFLPLFKETDVASRWAFAVRKPWLFCFVHWFVGTCYMFHFALFVGMCRKILRKGVLWFIRDPDDPTFHPVRDVLERNVTTQLRKIAFSALVYGALVILCLGGVIWTIGRLFNDIFPIHWVSTEPVLEFPLDMLLYNFVTPILIRLFKPSDAVNEMYAWWLRRCARALRLSHFLFDDRRKDEEGHLIRRSWSRFSSRKQADVDADTMLGNEPVVTGQPEFKKDGTYVLTPCSDQYRPPKSEEAFFHLDENDAYIVDKAGKKNEHFAKIYIPPLFRIRISLFMVCLWLFSAFAGLCSTLVPLVLGRYLLLKVLPEGLRVSDIYAYSLGTYIVGGILFAVLKGKAAAGYVKTKASFIDVRVWIEPMKRFSIKALKCAYLYGFLGGVLPILFALFLQFYIVLPLHTWATSVAASATSEVDAALAANDTLAEMVQNLNLTQALTGNSTSSGEGRMGSVAEHTFHVLQDYVLGLLYVRVFSRMIIATPASRAAEAFRRVTADGYLNPDVRLATRFFILPATLIATVVLTLPPLLTKAVLLPTEQLMPEAIDSDLRTKFYRYSYPIAASVVVTVLGTAELGKATSRWRARIRDEAYLVGERLHNFGEKKPPPGSKSVVRKER